MEPIRVKEHQPDELELIWPPDVQRWDVYFDEVMDMWESGDIDNTECKRLLTRLLRRVPQFVDIYNTLGTIAWHDEEMYTALALFQRAIMTTEEALPQPMDGALPWSYSGNRPYLRALHNFALCLLYFRQYERACDILDYELSINPDDTQGAQHLLERIQRNEIAFTLPHRLSQILDIPEEDTAILRTLIEKADELFFAQEGENVDSNYFEVESERMDNPYYVGVFFYVCHQHGAIPQSWLFKLAQHAARICKPLTVGGIPGYIFNIYAFLIERNQMTPTDTNNLRDLLYLRPFGGDWGHKVNALTLGRYLKDLHSFSVKERLRLLFLLLSYDDIRRQDTRDLMDLIFESDLCTKREKIQLTREIIHSGYPSAVNDKEYHEYLSLLRQKQRDQEIEDLWEYYESPERSHAPLPPTPELSDLLDEFEKEAGLAGDLKDEFAEQLTEEEQAFFQNPSPFWSENWDEEVPAPMLPISANRHAVRWLARLHDPLTVLLSYRIPNNKSERMNWEVRLGVLDALEENTGKLASTEIEETLHIARQDSQNAVRSMAYRVGGKLLGASFLKLGLEDRSKTVRQTVMKELEKIRQA